MKKVKDKKRFKAVILGMEHHNALDVARQLCLSGIKPYGVINCYRFSKLKLSRYWKQCKTVKNEEEGIKVAVKYFGDEKERPVLITCTDRYAKIVDENIHYLSKYFICPGVGDQGKLSQMMYKEW